MFFKKNLCYKLVPLLYSSVMAFISTISTLTMNIYIQKYIFFSIEFIYRRAGDTHRAHAHATENATLASIASEHRGENRTLSGVDMCPLRMWRGCKAWRSSSR